MAQADGSCANASGSAFRADLNTQLAAAFTNHSGATAPATTFAYQFWADTTSNKLKIRNSGNTGWVDLRGLDGSLQVSSASALTVGDGTATAPSLGFTSDTDTGIFKSSANTIGVALAGTQKLLIGEELATDMGGISILWNTTLNPANNSSINGFQVANHGRVNVGNFGSCAQFNRHSTTGEVVLIKYNASQVGSIDCTASSTSYTTSSDYRLKENVVGLTGAKARLNQLDVKRFNFIAEPSETVDGFLAHEAATVVPEAVTGEKDQMDENGDPKYQGIDQSKLVPLLTAALQEAFAEIAALTTRIETLEAG